MKVTAQNPMMEFLRLPGSGRSETGLEFMPELGMVLLPAQHLMSPPLETPPLDTHTSASTTFAGVNLGTKPTADNLNELGGALDSEKTPPIPGVDVVQAMVADEPYVASQSIPRPSLPTWGEPVLPEASRPQTRLEGDSQTVLYPQLLTAIGRLSQAAIDHPATPVAIDRTRTQARPTSLAQNPFVEGDLQAAQADLSASRGTQLAKGQMTAQLHEDAGAAIADSDRAAARERTLLVAAPWAAKLLRVDYSDENSATVWVRDFALDGDSMQHLVHAIRRAAEGAQLALKRIVVNGHLAWSFDGGVS